MWLWRAGDAYVLTMKNHLIVVLFFASTVSFVSKHVHGQSLSPPPINIARGKNIVATSTCGVGVSEPELFCKLATVPGRLGIYGLSCDHCDPSTPSKNHSIEYAVDGTEKWWQSPPLSRGLQFQEVNITIDLGQVINKDTFSSSLARGCSNIGKLFSPLISMFTHFFHILQFIPFFTNNFSNFGIVCIYAVMDGIYCMTGAHKYMYRIDP